MVTDIKRDYYGIIFGVILLVLGIILTPTAFILYGIERPDIAVIALVSGASLIPGGIAVIVTFIIAYFIDKKKLE